MNEAIKDSVTDALRLAAKSAAPYITAMTKDELRADDLDAAIDAAKGESNA